MPFPRRCAAFSLSMRSVTSRATATEPCTRCGGQFDGQGDHHTPAPYVEKAFRKYLECRVFAPGFARARCDDCGHDYLVAVSCKGRGVYPSCNTR